MKQQSFPSRPIIATALSLACGLFFSGCGPDDGIGQRFKVYGTVKLNGEPLKKGTINFIPEDTETARPASGSIQEDGTYALTTQTPGDGAMGGKYKVAVNAYDVEEKNTAPFGGVADQRLLAKVKKTSIIPLKYTGTDSSGFTAIVGPSSSKFDFEMEGAPETQSSKISKNSKR
ncbi:hypothetical protein ACYOEI_20745 [Singulisphaera rosea]